MSASRAGVLSGMITGFIVLITVLAIRRTRQGKPVEFDERQEAIRGRGYKYAYLTLLFTGLIYAVAFDGLERPVIEPALGYLGIFFVSAMVLAVYTIWNDAYWGFAQKGRKSLITAWIAIVVMMLVIGFGKVRDGEFMVNGTITFDGGMPFLVSAFMIVFIGVQLVKAYVSKRGGDEE